MNRRLISVLMFAFLVAGTASAVLYKLVTGRMSAAPAATSSVLVASKNLELGSVIVDADLRVAAWPGALPEGAIVNAAAAVGRGVVAPIYANEPITQSRLGLLGAGGGLAATIPQGYRAVAIRVNEVVGLAGFVVAGTHVDVLVSGIPPGAAGAAGGNVSRTLLQNIPVLSAGQDFKKDTEGKPVSVQVVNLQVTPQEAEILSLAAGQMTIQLVLRNPLDMTKTATAGVTLSSIFRGLEPAGAASQEVPRPRAVKPVHAAAAHVATVPVAVVAVAPPPPPELSRLEVISGGKRTEMKFQKVEVR